MVKPNYSFEKRQRDLAKKQKQEAKRRQKLADKTTVDGSDHKGAEASSLATRSGPDIVTANSPDDATTPDS